MSEIQVRLALSAACVLAFAWFAFNVIRRTVADQRFRKNPLRVPKGKDRMPKHIQERRAEANKELRRLKDFDAEIRAVELLTKRMPDVVFAWHSLGDAYLYVTAAVPMFRTHRAEILRALAGWGYRQTSEPDFDKTCGTMVYRLGRIRLKMTSQSCKRVKVGSKTIPAYESPIYETKCD